MTADAQAAFASYKAEALEAMLGAPLETGGSAEAPSAPGQLLSHYAPEAGLRMDAPEARAGEGGVRVTRLSAAVDIGRIVNLDLARQQIEGGLIYGLSLAVGSAIGFNGGLPTTSRLAGLNLPTLADSPQIAVEFVASDDPPFDPGELGTVIAAPAIANALSSATGQRFRSLPLDLASAQPS